MKIERLSMKNWRGFFGEHEIEFSTNNEKPITVLIGANKTGKSDILRAIHWVLFDETPEFTNKSTRAKIKSTKPIIINPPSENKNGPTNSLIR